MSEYFAVGIKGNWDFSESDHLQLWIKVPKEMWGIVKVILRGDAGTWLQWFVSDFPRDRWVGLNLPFDKPTGMSNPKLNLKAIRHIDVGFATKSFANISFLKIDDIVLTKESLFLSSQEIKYLLNGTSILMLTHDPNVDLSMLLPWVESGNKIMVLNVPQNNATGFFSDFLGLKVLGKNESNEIEFQGKIASLPTCVTPFLATEASDVHPLFWYGLNGTPTSPFIFSKKTGSGEILYMTLPSELIVPKLGHLPLLLEIFKNVLNLTKLNIADAPLVVNSLPSYSTIEGYLNINGSVKILTKHLLNAQPIDATLEVKSENSSVVFDNVTINSLIAYGSSQLVAQNASVRVGPISISTTYLSFSYLGNRELPPIELSVDEATIEISNSSSTTSVFVKDALIILHTSDLSLFIRSPVMIESRGEMYLNLATITYGAPYTPLVGAIREEITIKGAATVITDLSTKNLIMIDNFWYSGTAHKGSTLTRVTFEFPWFALLTSPIFFVFLVLILIVAFMKLGTNNELMRDHKTSLSYLM